MERSALFGRGVLTWRVHEPSRQSVRGIASMVIYDYHVTMKRIGVAELKAKLSEYLRAVRKGHELTVYDRDQPIARLVPYAVGGALSVREPTRTYRTLGDIPLPPPASLDVDAVDWLLEDRRSEGGGDG